ncbi:MAG: hypothetical protein ACREUF_04360 [Solimonas sp.]
MNHEQSSFVKAGVVWSGVGISKFLESIGISSWGDFAAMLAAVYSAFLIFDWLRKQWRSR